MPSFPATKAKPVTSKPQETCWKLKWQGSHQPVEWSMTHHDTFLQMAIGKMTFLCGSLLRIPKKVSIFTRLPGTWGNQIYDSSDLFSLDYQTWKWQWSDRHSIIQYAGPVSNLDRYASILRQQGRCRNGWWGQCQDPDQGATRHCDVRDSVCFTFPWNGPYCSNISTVHILGRSIQVAKGWCILWSFEK